MNQPFFLKGLEQQLISTTVLFKIHFTKKKKHSAFKINYSESDRRRKFFHFTGGSPTIHFFGCLFAKKFILYTKRRILCEYSKV